MLILFPGLQLPDFDKDCWPILLEEGHAFEINNSLPHQVLAALLYCVCHVAVKVYDLRFDVGLWHQGSRHLMPRLRCGVQRCSCVRKLWAS